MFSALKYALILIGLFLLITSPSNVLAQNTTTPPATSPSTGQPVTSTNYKAPQNANYTMQNLFHAALCELVFMSPAGQCVSLVKEGDTTQLKAFDPKPGGGVVGGMTNVMVAMYAQPPTSTSEYLADAAQGFGIIQPVHAQVIGSGAGIVEPVRLLWQVVRNIAYVAFTIIFVVVGFMIMLRRKINPQTVITIQQALPGLVMGLFLVTFSYFIASLLIDISFFTIQLAGRIFTSPGLPNSFGNQQEIIGLAQDSNAFKLYWEPAKSSLGSIPQIGGAVLETIGSAAGADGDAGQRLSGFLITGGIGALIAVIIGGFAWLPVLTGVAAGVGVVTLIIPLILLVAFVIQFFKLLFALIRAYITLLVMTVLGPFFIVISTLPGRSGALTFWWKSILANALVFPAVFIAFLFVGMILAIDPSNWRVAPPLFGGLSTVILQVIVGYGIILGLPAVPNMVKQSLGVKDIQGLPEAAQAGFMGGWKRLSDSSKKAYNRQMEESGLKKYHDKQRNVRIRTNYENVGKDRFWTSPMGQRMSRRLPPRI